MSIGTPLSAVRVIRICKAVLMAAMAAFFTLVVFNNVTDFQSNYMFVHHVLEMDTTFPGNHGMWRAIHPAATQLVFYLGIIAYEALSMVLCWWAACAMFAARDGSTYTRARAIGVAALTVGILLWLVAFLEVGGEWFLMWQSKVWNGQDAAFRWAALEGILLVVWLMPEDQERL